MLLQTVSMLIVVSVMVFAVTDPQGSGLLPHANAATFPGMNGTASALTCSGSYVITGSVPWSLSPAGPLAETPVAGLVQLVSNGPLGDPITFSSPAGAIGSLWIGIDASGAVSGNFQIGTAHSSVDTGFFGTASADCSLIQIQGTIDGMPFILTLVPGSTLPTATPTGPPTSNCSGFYALSSNSSLLPLAGGVQLSDTNGTVRGILVLTAPVLTSGQVTATVDTSGAITGALSIPFFGPTAIPISGQTTPTCATATLTATLTLPLIGTITETIQLTQATGPTTTPTSTVTLGPTATGTVHPTDTPTPTATSTHMPTPTAIPTSTGTIGPPAGNACNGVYSVVSEPGISTGLAQLTETNGMISGLLHLSSPLQATGVVTAVEGTDGTVRGVISLSFIGSGALAMNGQANADCSSVTLAAPIYGVAETFTLTRQAQGTATPTASPTDTPTNTPIPSDTPTRMPTAIPTMTYTPIPTRAPTNTPMPPTLTSTATPTVTSMPTGTPSTGPRLQTNTTSTSPFQQVVLTGLNFGPLERVAIYWDNVHTVPLTTTHTTATGMFTILLTVPQAISGTHPLIGVGQRTLRVAATALHITPEIVLVPAVGMPGQHVVTAGFGFGPWEPVIAYWDKPLDVLGMSITNRLGSFVGTTAITATVPLSTPLGQHVVSVVGHTSHGIGVAGFEVY